MNEIFIFLKKEGHLNEFVGCWSEEVGVFINVEYLDQNS